MKSRVISGGPESIKPCPFCGEVPYLERRPLWQTYSDGTTHGYFGCYCYEIACRNNDCGCSVKLGRNDTVYTDDEAARRNAIAAWNRRVMIGRIPNDSDFISSF